MQSLGQSSMDLGPVRQSLAEEGLEFLGIVAVPLGSEGQSAQQVARERYLAWLSRGGQASMQYLARHEPGKYDPSFALEGTQAVIMVGLGYAQARPEPAEGRGLVARYAWGRDYHKVLVKKLQRVTKLLADVWPDQSWRSFTDTAPLDERWWAEQAGGAFTARNALSINRRLGSWFLLGEILTTVPFPSTPKRAHEHGGCPSGCRRCRDVCPTGALSSEGQINASRCISYLTIEHRGPIDDGLKKGLGSWLFGCDLCQEVCPFNLQAPLTSEPEFLAWKAGPDLDLAAVLALDEASFSARFAGSPVHRTGRAGLVRNACVVAGNLDRKELQGAIGALVDDPDEGVADAARWTLEKWKALL